MSTVIPAESLPRWSRYAAMKRDFGHDGVESGDGVLTLRELDEYIDRLEDTASTLRANGRSTRLVDMDIAESREMQGDILAAGAEGLSYLPPQIRDAGLPKNLMARAAEVLWHDDNNQEGKLTSAMLSRAARRYSASGRTPGSLRNQSVAVEEIQKLKDALGL